MKKITKSCPVCTKPFTVAVCHADRHVTCGYKCGGIYRRKPIVNNICKNCKTEFVSKKSHTLKQDYCSRACGHLGNKSGEQRKCHTCSGMFYVPRYKAKQKTHGKYCSQDCRLKDWNESSLAAQMPGSYRENAWKVYERKCYDCGITDARVLVIHHIDGNRKNGKLDNLIPVCHNCHCIRHIMMSGNHRLPSYRGED